MSRQIESLAARRARGPATQRSRAVCIASGVPARLDEQTPALTLDDGVGDTSAKTALFVALLQAAGLSARQHFVTIDHGILRGISAHGAHRLLPWEILHSYAEVEVEGRWCSVDSYALDYPLWRGATARLAFEGGLLGYGAHRDGTCRWSGRGHAFAQLATPDIVVEDHGAYASLREFRLDRVRATDRTKALAAPLLELARGPAAAVSARCINESLDRIRAWRAVPATVSASA
jgi:hypothetical protein